MSKQNQSGIRKGKIRVLLVDDHPVLRRGLAQMINAETDMTVCGEAEDSGKGFELVGTLAPDVAVIDISLKTGNGIELVKNVKARYPDMIMLVLSMYDESLYAERALRAGSRGYIMKEEASEQIVVAIRRVKAGEIFLSEKMKSKMLHQLATGAKAVISPLEQ
ncbi:MAG TPA: response regulator transcription factor, partial [Verrucomicrobiae bacterium]|nr:response regulator transcription factor [Verrucomicrobiae bacterium]